MRISASFAAMLGENDKLHTYLNKGVDIDSLDDYGNTLLMETFDGNSYHVHTFEFLLKEGANPEKCSPDKKPPLVDIAYQTGNVELLQLLIDHGANVNITDKWGGSALYYATQHQFLDAVAQLIKNGADVNCKTQSGETPINGKATHLSDMVSMLLDAGADPSIASDDGITPIMNAAKANSTDVIEMLIQAGADPNIADLDGNRAIEYAKRENNHIAVKFLEKYSGPVKTGFNPKMLPVDLGMPGSIPAGTLKLDIENLLQSFGFKDFNTFHTCFKYSGSYFDEELQKEASSILGNPTCEVDKTKLFYSQRGIFEYTQKVASQYLESVYLLPINTQNESVEVIHFRWTEAGALVALDITNVTRKDKEWQQYQLHEEYIKNLVKDWMKWQSTSALK